MDNGTRTLATKVSITDQVSKTYKRHRSKNQLETISRLSSPLDDILLKKSNLSRTECYIVSVITLAHTPCFHGINVK